MTISVDWLPDTAFYYILIFARVGTMFMLVPGFGESFLPPRIRLALALMVSLVFFPLVVDGFPPLNDDFTLAVTTLTHEILVGLIFGGVMRILIMATQVAGASIAFQTGLSMAQTADPTQEGVQGAVIGNFMGMLAIALIFATDLHHMVLSAIYGTYTIYPVDMPLMFGDSAQLAVDTFSRTFMLGVQMSTPFIVFGLIFYLGLGLLSKLMPQLQVFFLAMPANIWLGFILLAVLLSMIMGWYLTHLEAELANYLP